MRGLKSRPYALTHLYPCSWRTRKPFSGADASCVFLFPEQCQSPGDMLVCLRQKRVGYAEVYAAMIVLPSVNDGIQRLHHLLWRPRAETSVQWLRSPLPTFSTSLSWVIKDVCRHVPKWLQKARDKKHKCHIKNVHFTIEGKIPCVHQYCGAEKDYICINMHNYTQKLMCPTWTNAPLCAINILLNIQLGHIYSGLILGVLVQELFQESLTYRGLLMEGLELWDCDVSIGYHYSLSLADTLHKRSEVTTLILNRFNVRIYICLSNLLSSGTIIS